MSIEISLNGTLSNFEVEQLWLNTSVVPGVLNRWAGAEWIKASPTEAGDIGAETPDGAQSKADDAESAAKDALAYELGYADFDDMVYTAQSQGKTLIIGGYINTDMIEAGTISSDHIVTTGLDAKVIKTGKLDAERIDVQIGGRNLIPESDVDKVDRLDLATLTPTPEEYFTFDANTQTITGYDIDGGLDVIIPGKIGGVEVLHIGESAFDQTYAPPEQKIKTIVLPETLVTIGPAAFNGVWITMLVVPNSVTDIGLYAFINTLISYAILPANINTDYSGSLGIYHLQEFYENNYRKAGEYVYDKETMEWSFFPPRTVYLEAGQDYTFRAISDGMVITKIYEETGLYSSLSAPSNEIVKWTPEWTGEYIVDFRAVGSPVSVRAKLERGNMATDWTPAPEDSALSKLADGNYSGGTFIDGTTVISPTIIGLQGTFADLMAGDPFGARLELGESDGEPFLDMFDEDGLRYSLRKDSITFFGDETPCAEMIADRVTSKDWTTFSLLAQTGIAIGVDPSMEPCGGVDLQNYIYMLDYGDGSQGKVLIRSLNGVVVIDGKMAEIMTTEGVYLSGGYAPNYGEVIVGSHLVPNWDTVLSLGSSSKRFTKVYASGGVATTSDRALKVNILSVEDNFDCYDLVKSLRFKTYSLKKDAEEKSFMAQTYMGVIADESPDIVCEPDKKNINLYSYTSLIGAALQETQCRLEALESKLFKEEK